MLGQVSYSIVRWCSLSSQTLFESTMELRKTDLFPSCHSVMLRPCNKLPLPKPFQSSLAKHFHGGCLPSKVLPSPKPAITRGL